MQNSDSGVAADLSGHDVDDIWISGVCHQAPGCKQLDSQPSGVSRDPFLGRASAKSYVGHSERTSGWPFK